MGIPVLLPIPIAFQLFPINKPVSFIKLKNEIVATFDMEQVLNKWKAKYDENHNDYLNVPGDEFNIKAEGGSG